MTGQSLAILLLLEAVIPAHQSRLVRVMSEEQIVGITGTLPYATSAGRNWTGVEVHRYRVSGPSF